MKNIMLVLLFISIRSIAGESAYVNYFKGFVGIFSHPTISDVNYSMLSSYKLNPELFINFDKSPPDSFRDDDKNNSNVIFNGSVSKKYFMDFVSADLISGDSLNKLAKKTFKSKDNLYSFEFKVKNEHLVILENMLISAPEDMTSEISCSYEFSSVNKNQLKLVDVVCAG